ncbi:T9SS type B sorting domain-containing protein [Flavobacterium degerlachei]|jgi:gliding motility-associated-like protein|uniref:Gliding motility-associated C-terminal domain-containing protein n=1 Tax=Flavobacterium degerlachei TaxID=229203 RepID=A0A1H3ABA5_9FLAO|nr:T9SS type B sorting domain-containing protein [Flavobacterium degerlachei]SDX27000.1 gliding motility-associated C-terminal domain-containing protein [Flavobacterium degerlachei]
MKWIKTTFCILICYTKISATAQSITVNDSYTAQNLVGLLTNNSSCANTSDPTAFGDTFSGTQNSYGYFNAGTSAFPFTEGVLLSTWSSVYSKGPFIREPASGPNSGTSNWTGDADLEQALGITNSSNATALEFNFTAMTNTISFNYLFASNEYQDNFPCNYSDGFAFLIKEIGTTTYQNLAVIPGTNTPVSSKNVHPAIPEFNSTTGPKPGCPAINETYFGSLNTSPTNTSPINYSGQTKVLNAQTTVDPGKTYHVKLVIADQGGYYYDSAIFIEAGSFSSKINLGSNQTIATNNPICFGESYIIDTKLSPTYSYKWFKNNSATPIPGEISPSLTVTDSGIYDVEIELGSLNCIATGQITIEYTPEIVLNNQTMVQCDDNGDGISVFDLTKMDTAIKNNDSSLSAVVYYQTLSNAKAAINPIANPKSFNNTVANQIIFARVSNSYGCTNYAELKLQISNSSIAPQNPIVTCDGDTTQDGLYHFVLNSQVSPQVLQGLPQGLAVEYYLNPPDAVLQNNSLPNIFNNTVPNQQIIYARIINGADCYDITPITLAVNTFNPINFQEENTSLCNGNAISLAVATGYSSYLWNTGETTRTITASASGDYSVKVTNGNGCEATKTFHITPSGIATITGAEIIDFSGNQNSVLIEYTGVGNYEFSVDGYYFQDDPKFEGLAPDTYTAYARDKNGCGLSDPFVFYVLDYPRYFTPNGDGFNDTWRIKNLNLLPQSTVTIYDRYGKLLKQLNSSTIEWNGLFNGSALSANDYWFSTTFEDGKIIKGHFSLKR